MRTHANTARALLGAVVLAATACAAGPARHATSIVGYLYPDRSERVEATAIPELRLPLRVGVAFVPNNNDRCGACDRDDFSEAQRMTLMKEVAAHFKDPAMVKTIEIIPSSYLTPRGSFANLDQLRNMFGIDVIALISYDQIQFTNEGRSSLTYWTLVGAYLVEGEKNDTRTLMDAVVYDIPSRRLLFRAPGVSTVKGSSTPVNLEEELRHDGAKGFRLASADLVTNLDAQLAEFKTKVKEAPEEYHVTRRSGGGDGKGGGSVDGWMAGLVATLAVLGASGRTRRRA